MHYHKRLISRQRAREKLLEKKRQAPTIKVLIVTAPAGLADAEAQRLNGRVYGFDLLNSIPQNW
jgi:hypothetical protein